MMTISELKKLSTIIDTSTGEHDNDNNTNDSTDKPDNSLLLPNPWFNRTDEENAMMTSSIEVLIKRIPTSTISSTLPLTPIGMETTTTTATTPLVRSRDVLLDLYREMTRLSAETTTVALNELVATLQQWSDSLQKEMQRLRDEKSQLYGKFNLWFIIT
jgi:hypothetical protein